MKGTIVRCIEDLVTTKFGAAKWHESLKKAGVSESKRYSTIEDVPDSEVLALINAVAGVLSLSATQVMNAFGEYWVNTYAPGIYKPYFDHAKSTREFLLNLDEIHVAMTRTMKSAKPPRFTYQWRGDKVLVMNYQSERGLVALMPGLIAGLGKYYKDHPSVHVSGNSIEIQFA
jgi:hypothetical protein